VVPFDLRTPKKYSAVASVSISRPCRLTVTISQRHQDAKAQQEKPAVNATDTHSMPQVVPLAIGFDEDFSLDDFALICERIKRRT